MADEKTKAPATANFRVLTPVKYDKKIYRKGAVLRLTAKEAAPLLQHKAIEEAK